MLLSSVHLCQFGLHHIEGGPAEVGRSNIRLIVSDIVGAFRFAIGRGHWPSVQQLPHHSLILPDDINHSIYLLYGFDQIISFDTSVIVRTYFIIPLIFAPLFPHNNMHYFVVP